MGKKLFMLALVFRRFQVMGEVSLCLELSLIAKETEQGVTITLSNFPMYHRNDKLLTVRIVLT